jgi:hypothetical protein
VVDTNGSDLDLQFLNPKLLFYFLLDGAPGFRAQTANALVGVIAGKRRQIHAGNRPQKPRRLPFFFHSSSRDMGLNAALDCAGVNSDFAYPIQVEGNADVPQQRPAGERGNRTAAVVRDAVRHASIFVVFDRHHMFSAKHACEKNAGIRIRASL